MVASEHPPPAVVIALDCITGLQTARILAGRRVPVIAVAKDRRHYCCRTRVCQEIHQADTGSEALVELLERLGPSLRSKAVLFPCADMSVLTVARHRDRLQRWYHVDLPPLEVVETLMDKGDFCRLAQRSGLPIPETQFLHNRADAERAAEELTYPCILKPTLKTRTWEQNTKHKVFLVDSPAALLKTYDRCHGWAEVLMVQQWIPGSDAELYSCNLYFDAKTRPLVTFQARKLRQWPPQTGTSTLGEECRNPGLVQAAIELFEKVGFRGLGYVEMKRDPRTGRQYIIEPNVGRPTGRSAIAEAAGVELVYTMYCNMVGWPLPENRQQQFRGVKWVHLRRDFQSAWHYWRRGELTLREWWQSWRGRKGYAVFAWSDPGPFLAELVYAAAKLLGLRPRVQSFENDRQPSKKTSAAAAELSGAP